MADDVKIQLGAFLRKRFANPDTSADMFAPGGIIDEPDESFLNVARPKITIGTPRTAQFQPPPELSRPRQLPPVVPAEVSPPPALPPSPIASVSPTHPADRQPPLPTTPTRVTPMDWVRGVTPARPPAGPRDILPPHDTRPAARQSAEPVIPTSPAPRQPSQDPGVPPPVGPQPAPPTRPLSVLQRVFAEIDASEHIPAGLRAADKAVLDALAIVDNGSGVFSLVGGGAPGTQSWNPQLFTRSVMRLSQQLGAARVGLHALRQNALYALNWHGKIWNPVTLVPTPGIELYDPGAADVVTGGSPPNDILPGGVGGMKFYSNNEVVNDRHRQLAEGRRNEVLALSNPPFVANVIKAGAIGPQNLAMMGTRLIGAASQDTSLVDDPVYGRGGGTIGQPIVEAALQTRNIYTDELRSDENPVYSHRDLWDASVSESGPDADLIVKDSDTGLNRVAVKRLFTSSPISLRYSPPMEYRPKPNLAETRGNRAVDPLAKGFFARGGIVPAGFKGETKGFVQHGQDEAPGNVVDDDDAYVPLSFTDIRPYGNRKLRTVYFRPFITNLAESFSPEWTKSSGFGRVDPVAGYSSTGRTITMGFVAHAFAPQDLRVIYQKLTWLASMTYPEYDKDLAYKSGPVVRVRVGDLVSSTNPAGLAAIIENLEIDYTDQVWELARDNKVPHGYRVSLTLTVLHDTPIGRGIDGKFGGLGALDGNGRFTLPLAQADSAGKLSTPVGNSSGFRKFAEDVNDYDPKTRE